MRLREKHQWVAPSGKRKVGDSELAGTKKLNLPISWLTYIYCCKCPQIEFFVLSEPKLDLGW